MKQFFYGSLVSLLLLTCYALAGAQNIDAEAKLQQYTIRIGDQTKLFISIHQPVKEVINFPKLTDTVAGKVLLVSTNKPDTVFDPNDKSQATVTHSYSLTSFDPGTYTIPAYTIVTKGGTAKTSELTLQVQTVKVDTTKGIYDIKQPLAVSYSWLDWLRDNWKLVLIIVAITLLVVGLIYYLIKRPKKASAPKPIQQPALPIHVIALNKLEEIKEQKLWQQGEFKQYYSELSDVLREYIEKRYQVKTHEQTTDEIFAALRSIEIDADNRANLAQVLQLADLVKFAKARPVAAENELTMDNAINFVLKTPLVIEAPKHTEGGSNDETA